MINLFFVFDEYTDIATDDVAQYLADITKDALRNPHKPRSEGEHFFGQITRQCVPPLFVSSYRPYTDLPRDSGPGYLAAPP